MPEKSLEQLVKFEWNNDEYWDDALWRGAVVCALKLRWKKSHPRWDRIMLAKLLVFAWIEFRAFVDYEQGRFFVRYGKDAMNRLGCSKVFYH
jgi:hypothetical protein